MKPEPQSSRHRRSKVTSNKRDRLKYPAAQYPQHHSYTKQCCYKLQAVLLQLDLIVILISKKQNGKRVVVFACCNIYLLLIYASMFPFMGERNTYTSIDHVSHIRSTYINHGNSTHAVSPNCVHNTQ